MLTVHRRGLLLQVSVSVGHNREHYKNDQTDPGTVLDMNSGEPKEPCIKWGSGSPPEEGAILDLPAHRERKSAKNYNK